MRQLLSLILLLLASCTPAEEPEPGANVPWPPEQCAHRTGSSSHVVFPAPLDADTLYAIGASGVCAGRAAVPDSGSFALAVWGDDAMTTVPDGLRAGERFWLVSGAGDTLRPDLQERGPPYRDLLIYRPDVLYATGPPPEMSWQSTDIGNVPVAGSMTLTDGVMTLTGTGTTYMFGADDEGHFAYQQLAGDFDVSARLADSSMANDGGGKAGIHVMEELRSGAKGIISVWRETGDTSTDDAYGSVRSTADASTTDFDSEDADVALPEYLRIVRTGDTFDVYHSDDGQTWHLIGSQTLALPDTVYVGLFIAPYQSTLISVTFDQIEGWPSVQQGEELVQIGQADPAVTLMRSLALSGDGNTLYASTDGGLGIYDVSDPTNITLVASYATGVGIGLELDDAAKIVYYGLQTDPFEVRFYDVSDPLAVAEVGSYAVGEGIPGLAKIGNYLYVGTLSTGGLHVVDVSDPSAPAKVQEIPGTDIEAVWCIEPMMIGGVQHLVSGGEYLAGISGEPTDCINVWDASTPSSIAHVSFLELGIEEQIHWSAIATDEAREVMYVADGQKLWIIDVSTPASPGIISQTRIDSNFPEEWVSCAYDPATQQVALGSDSVNDDSSSPPCLRVFDVSDLSAPASIDATENYRSRVNDTLFGGGIIYTAAAAESGRTIDTNDKLRAWELQTSSGIALSGTAQAAAEASAALVRQVLASAAAAGSTSAQAGLSVLRQLEGQAAADAGAQAALTAARQLVGVAQGAASARADLTKESGGLSAVATASGGAEARLTRAALLVATAEATGQATGELTAARLMAATGSANAGVLASLAITRLLQGQGAASAAASAQLSGGTAQPRLTDLDMTVSDILALDMAVID